MIGKFCFTKNAAPQHLQPSHVIQVRTLPWTRHNLKCKLSTISYKRDSMTPTLNSTSWKSLSSIAYQILAKRANMTRSGNCESSVRPSFNKLIKVDEIWNLLGLPWLTMPFFLLTLLSWRNKSLQQPYLVSVHQLDIMTWTISRDHPLKSCRLKNYQTIL